MLQYKKGESLKLNLLYYDILHYHTEALELLLKNFKVTTLQDPGFDTDDVLQNTEILMAPLGFTVDKQKIDRCSNLKVIASSTLSVPHIDTEYAGTKGIRIIHLGDEKAFLETITPTAEMAFGLIVAITRHLPSACKAALDARWGGRPFGHRTPKMLSRMSLGIIGLGRLGRMVASYGAAFGMKVCYFSPRSRDNEYRRCQSLFELARTADVVSLHAHHTPETEKMIDSEFFEEMRPGSYIVNTARGAVVDETAMLHSLVSGHLGGAALDVLADEFEPHFKKNIQMHPLVKYARRNENLIITPHCAGATLDAWVKTQTRTVGLIIDALKPLTTGCGYDQKIGEVHC
jgi:D-3-phosphoglycerate dehydrogenase / 2-oxoglutarate reductase